VWFRTARAYASIGTVPALEHAVEPRAGAAVVRRAPAPLSRWRPTPARFTQLLVGLWAFGVGEALLVASDLGNSPWTVLSEGLAKHTPLSVGAATIVISALVLCAWLPLRQRPGLGTIVNAILIGVAIDVTLGVLPDHMALGPRWAFVPLGIAFVSLGSGLYLTSRLGPGPRDGLMTGLHRRTGRSLRLVRVCIELTVVVGGFALGGTVGPGTLAFALLIGPGVQLFVHRMGGRDTQSL
jgi:uncharacterized membrane protein YczE